MSVPRLSNLQFVVLGSLRADPLSGREIRDRLEEFGLRKSGPGFYQIMSRLEDAGFVEGWYTQEVVEGQIIRERHYRLSATGSRVWSDNRDFHLRVIERFGGADGVIGA